MKKFKKLNNLQKAIINFIVICVISGLSCFLSTLTNCYNIVIMWVGIITFIINIPLVIVLLLNKEKLIKLFYFIIFSVYFAILLLYTIFFIQTSIKSNKQCYTPRKIESLVIPYDTVGVAIDSLYKLDNEQFKNVE